MARRIVSLSVILPVLGAVLIVTLLLEPRGRRARATPTARAHAAIAKACGWPATAKTRLAALGPTRGGAAVAADPPGVIDGSKDPQLIPDIVAYRLWFATVALGPNPTTEQQRRQNAQLLTAGLKGEDVGRAASALETFRTGYDYLIRSYNDSVARANEIAGTPPDLQAFLSQRDALVQSTEDALASALTLDGTARLKTYVRGQKVNMRVAPGDR